MERAARTSTRFQARYWDLKVNTSGPAAGGKVTITYDAFGRNAGEHDILASLASSVVQGVTTDRETITVTSRAATVSTERTRRAALGRPFVRSSWRRA